MHGYVKCIYVNKNDGKDVFVCMYVKPERVEEHTRTYLLKK